MNTKILSKCTQVSNEFHTYHLFEDKGILIFKSLNVSGENSQDSRLKVLEEQLCVTDSDLNDNYNHLSLNKDLITEIKSSKKACLNVFVKYSIVILYEYDYTTRRYTFINPFYNCCDVKEFAFAGFDPYYFKKVLTFFGKEPFSVYFNKTKFIFKSKQWEVYLFGCDSAKFKEFILNK